MVAACCLRAAAASTSTSAAAAAPAAAAAAAAAAAVAAAAAAAVAACVRVWVWFVARLSARGGLAIDQCPSMQPALDAFLGDDRQLADFAAAVVTPADARHRAAPASRGSKKATGD